MSDASAGDQARPAGHGGVRVPLCRGFAREERRRGETDQPTTCTGFLCCGILYPQKKPIVYCTVFVRPTEEGLISWISTCLFVFSGSCVVCARCAASVPHGCRAGLVDVVVVVVIAITTVLHTYFAPRAHCLGLCWTWIALRFIRRLCR